jgi:hypothetical protein
MNRRNLLKAIAAAPLAWLLPWKAREVKAEVLTTAFDMQTKIGKARLIRNALIGDSVAVDVELVEPAMIFRVRADDRGAAVDAVSRLVPIGHGRGTAHSIYAEPLPTGEWIVTAKLNV